MSDKIVDEWTCVVIQTIPFEGQMRGVSGQKIQKEK